MTDPDVEREIEANEERAREAEQAENDEGPIENNLENLVTPFTPGEVNSRDDMAEGPKDDDRSLLQKARDASSSPE